jgi:hypothetical protein
LPSKREVVLDIPKLGMKSYAYSYPNKNFIVTRHINENGSSITFSLVLDLNAKN